MTQLKKSFSLVRREAFEKRDKGIRIAVAKALISEFTPPAKGPAMNADVFIQTSLYFLALINPPSKVFLLSSMEPPYSRRELLHISAKSTSVALLILVVLSAIGHFLLQNVFRVEIYSLQVAGGIVLFIIGLTAVRKGRFYEQDFQTARGDISIVPLGAPLIAGPGTIAAAISFSPTHGWIMTSLSLIVALVLNFFIMLLSLWIGKLLERFHVFGPLIRITGLIVTAVAVQMVLSGLADWLISARPDSSA